MPRHDASNASQKVAPLPLLLARLIYAAHASGEGRPGGDVAAIVEILRRAGMLAQRAVPVGGISSVSHQEIASEIEQMAKSYLGLDKARHAVGQALQEVEPPARRDAIATAQSRVLEAQVTAHFYAGLAFGATLADLN